MPGAAGLDNTQVESHDLPVETYLGSDICCPYSYMRQALYFDLLNLLFAHRSLLLDTCTGLWVLASLSTTLTGNIWTLSYMATHTGSTKLAEGHMTSISYYF